MSLREITCSFCGKGFLREVRHINENIKFKHRSFCSSLCFSSASTTSKLLNCFYCNKEFLRIPSQIFKHSFCSHHCSATYFNELKYGKKIPKRLLSKEEKLVIIHEAIRKRWENYQSPLTKAFVISTIKNFVREKGRIPVKRELNKIYQPARKYFGTWNNAIKVAGFKPNPLRFSDHCIAKDGHVCDSLSEKIIDDMLFDNAISHERCVPYPGGIYTFDFKIGDIYIEFFGLAGEHKRYDELRNIKKKIIKKKKLELIEIYPQDIYKKERLDKILELLINKTTRVSYPTRVLKQVV